jgi:integrase
MTIPVAPIEPDDLQAIRALLDKYPGLFGKAVATCVLGQLVDAFLAAKALLLQSGELCARTFADYRQTCGRLVEVFGEAMPVGELGPVEWGAYRADLASRWGPTTLGAEITRIRLIFRFGFETGQFAHLPRFGQGLKLPSKKALRLAKAAKGPQMFEAHEVRMLLAGAGATMRAMILLGCNGALGPSDLARLPRTAVDLRTGWITYPRPKTGVARRIPLWPETVEALTEVLTHRPSTANGYGRRRPGSDALVFLTHWGTDWSGRSQLGMSFYRLCQRVGVLTGRGFYCCRRVFQTVASQTTDEVATSAIMGHVDPSMAAIYRQRIDDKRLRAVVDCVRRWVFAEGGNQS